MSWGGRRREAVAPAHNTLHYGHGASEAAGSHERFQPYKHFSPQKSNWTLMRLPLKVLLSVRYECPRFPGNCIDTNFNFFVKNTPHSWSKQMTRPEGWWSSHGLMHKMGMTGGNKSSLVHELHREIKAISSSSWGEQNLQSSLCWDLHIILLSET